MKLSVDKVFFKFELSHLVSLITIEINEHILL